MKTTRPYSRHDNPVLGTYCDPNVWRGYKRVPHTVCPQAPLNQPAGPGQCCCPCHQHPAWEMPLPLGEWGTAPTGPRIHIRTRSETR